MDWTMDQGLDYQTDMQSGRRMECVKGRGWVNWMEHEWKQWTDYRLERSWDETMERQLDSLMGHEMEQCWDLL